MVGASVVLGLWMLHAEAAPPTDLNDSGLHHSMVRWAADRISAAENPFDGWYPFLGLGFPQLHHYQSVPHVLTAVAGEVVGVARAYHWSLYLLLASWPVAVYASTRLLGLSEWTAASSAALSPLVVSVTSYGHEAGSYVWQGLGLWPQLWAMWLLPFALATTWRALDRTGPPWVAGALVAATVACHFPTGYLVLALTGVLVVVHGLLEVRSLWRGALVIGSAAALLAAVLAPLLLDSSGADYSGYDAGELYDSVGAGQVLGWAVTGHLLDHGRLPVLTVLAAIGLAVCVLRATREGPYLALLAVLGTSLVLLFGRPTLGAVADLLPFGHDLFFPRFIVGVHLAGIVLGGVGLTFLGVALRRYLDPLGPAELGWSIVGILGVALVLPAVVERIDYHERGRAFMDEQRRAEADAGDVRGLLDLVRDEDGRVYAGRSDGAGAQPTIGYVPLYALLLEEDVDAVGFLHRVASLGTAVEPIFDETSLDSYAIFGVRWLLLPASATPPVPATHIASSHAHALWSVDDTPGYARVVAGRDVVAATEDTLLATARAAVVDGRLIATSAPLIRWDGRAGSPTAIGIDQGTLGVVTVAVADPAGGSLTAETSTTSPAWLATSWSWHPRWTATVDGEPVSPAMLGPAVVGVPVPAGDHVVELRYRPSPWRWPLAAAGAAAFAMLVVLSRRHDRRVDADA